MEFNDHSSEIMIGILYAAPTLLQILIIFGGIIFALTRISRYPRPATWLAAGLTVILVGRVSGWIGTIYFARSSTSDTFVFYNSILSMILIVISTIGLVLMMYAAFVSRLQIEPKLRQPFGNTTDQNPELRDTSNPYSPPQPN